MTYLEVIGAPNAASETTSRRSMHVEDNEFAAISEGRIRIRIGLAMFIFVLVIAVLRLGEVALFSGKDKPSHYAGRTITARADMVDRNGELLATTLETYALYARPKFIWDQGETARAIAGLFPDLSPEMVLDRLSRHGDQLLIRRALTPKERQAVFALGLPGLIFQKEPQRVYPRGDLAAHIVGFSDIDMKGLAGAERAFDAQLATPNAPPLSLSVDMRVQYAVSNELSAALKRFEAKSVAGIVLDINTGEILSLVSLPNFDPNTPDTALPQNLYNHASMSTYELGSVFKPITLAMALDEGLVDLKEKLPVQNPITVRGNVIQDDHPSYVPLNVADILAKSSNRGTALLALRAGAERQQAFLRRLGLFDRVNFELSESAAPQVQSNWQDITIVTVSYGHGIAVTPLALANATSALLNGGFYIQPTLLKRDPANPAHRTRVIRPETSQSMRDLMRYVVTDGTGKNAAVHGYGVMGKTGSADKPDGSGYDVTRLVSTFVAAFPYENPSYLVLVTMDEPKASEETRGYATAGWNVAPTTGHIIERIAPILGVKKRPEALSQTPFSNGGAR